MKSEPITNLEDENKIPALKVLEGRAVGFNFPAQTPLHMTFYSKEDDLATFLIDH